MLQVITDAISDEDDWPSVAAGLRHPEQVQHQQALAVLATDELVAARRALVLVAMHWPATFNDLPAAVRDWVLDGTP